MMTSPMAVYCLVLTRSEGAVQRVGESCAEAGSDATWHESMVEEQQDREALQATDAVMQRIRTGGASTTSAADVFATLEADNAAKAQGEQEPYLYEITPCSAEHGGRRLRQLENGEEVGGGVFPLAEYAKAENAEEAASYACETALAEASPLLASRENAQ
jgi:hypothetical protein